MTATLIILAVSAILFVLGPIRSDLVAVCAAIALVDVYKRQDFRLTTVARFI